MEPRQSSLNKARLRRRWPAAKKHGCYCKITRLWWTSSWCNISVHPSKIHKSECPDVWIRFSTTQKWPKSWEKIEEPVVALETKLVRSSISPDLQWKSQFEQALLERGWEKIPNWECMFVHRKQGLFLSVYVDDIRIAGKKQNLAPMWKRLMKKNVDIDEPTSFLDHVYSGCTQRACEPNEGHHWTIHKNVRITYFCWSNREITGMAKNLTHKPWRGPYDMEVHAQKCVERYCEWHTRKWSNFRPLVQSGRTWISPRIVRSFITNCFEMLVLGTNWTTWHLVVREQSVKISHKLGLKHVINDKQSWIHIFITQMTIVKNCPCGEHGTALQTWVISRIRLCRRPSGFKVNLRRCIVYFLEAEHLFQSVGVCKKQTSVSHSSTESEIISLDAGHRIDGLPALDLWDILLSRCYVQPRTRFNLVTEAQGKLSMFNPTPMIPEPRPKRVNRKTRGWSIERTALRTHQHAFFSRGISVVHQWRQRSRDQDDN